MGQRERELANRTCGDLPMMSDERKPVAVPAENGGIERVAQAGGTLCNRVEHGLNIRGRTGNNTQDLACRSLLLQGFFEFLEQPDVFKCDHSLVGEGFKQLDLRRGEGAHLDVACAQRSNEFPLLTKGSS